MKIKNLLLAVWIIVGTDVGAAQSGGNFAVTQSVIASGGGQDSSGAGFTVDGTIGQPAAGTRSSGGTFRLRGGFWAFQALPPTAASVSLNGRVIISGGQMSRVQIILTDANSGMVRVARPNSFGYYSFDELEVGRLYIIRAESPHLMFTPPSYDIMLLDAAADIDFTGQEIP
jgi:hypothetical protein